MTNERSLPPEFTPEQVVRWLRDYIEAYPVDVFPPLTPDQITQNAEIVSRASAAMMRHIAPVLSAAIETIENLSHSSEPCEVRAFGTSIDAPSQKSEEQQSSAPSAAVQMTPAPSNEGVGPATVGADHRRTPKRKFIARGAGSGELLLQVFSTLESFHQNKFMHYELWNEDGDAQKSEEGQS